MLIGGAAATWPVMAQTQQTIKLPTVGLLAPGTSSTHGQWFSVFVRRLRELGWIEGQTVALAYRWAEGHPDHYKELATELIRMNVNVIFTTVPTVPTLKSVTSAIPIVFALGSDPVGGGLVASLSRPGGNVTGLSTQATDLTSKRVELLNRPLQIDCRQRSNIFTRVSIRLETIGYW